MIAGVHFLTLLNRREVDVSERVHLAIEFARLCNALFKIVILHLKRQTVRILELVIGLYLFLHLLYVGIHFEQLHFLATLAVVQLLQFVDKLHTARIERSERNLHILLVVVEIGKFMPYFPHAVAVGVALGVYRRTYFRVELSNQHIVFGNLLGVVFYLERYVFEIGFETREFAVRRREFSFEHGNFYSRRSHFFVQFIALFS